MSSLLFGMNGKNGRIKLSVKAEIKATRLRTRSNDHHLNIINKIVEFDFLGLNMDNSYPALSMVESLLKVFERGQFSQNTNGLREYVNIGSRGYDVWVKRVRMGKNGDKGVEFVVVGDSYQKNIRLSVGQGYQFHNALLKAMNWIHPEAELLNGGSVSI